MKLLIEPDQPVIFWNSQNGDVAVPLSSLVEGKVTLPERPIVCTLVPTFHGEVLSRLRSLAVAAGKPDLVVAVSAALEAIGGTAEELRAATARLQETEW